MNSRSGLIFVRSRPMFWVRGLRPIAIRILSASILCCLPSDRDGHRDACFCLVDLLYFRAGVEIDAAFAVDASEFFRDFFIFYRNEAREHFNDGDFAVERAINRCELYSDCTGSDDHQRFRDFFQAENFNIGQNAVADFEAGNHSGFRTGGENYVFRFELGGLAIIRDFDGVNAILGRAGELAVALDGLDFVLLHQKIKTLGVFSRRSCSCGLELRPS